MINDIPTILNLGSGLRPLLQTINADVDPRHNPDWVIDICNVPWNKIIQTRFGETCIVPGMFEKIIALDVFEHVFDLVSAMKNCKDLLCVGGILEISVPYDLGYSAWQDPTHVRAFNEISWEYFTTPEWTKSYFGWDNSFVLESLTFILTPYGETLKDVDLTKIPRAIHSMHVVLKK